MIFDPQKDRSIAKAVLADFNNNQKIREEYKVSQQEALDYFCPRRGNLDDMVSQGDKRGTTLYNSIGVQALKDWVDGYMGNHITSSEPWFNLNPAYIAIKTGNVSDEIAKYFQEATKAMFTLLSNTNYYIELPRFLKDGGSWGTAVGDVEFENGKIVYRTMHPRESFLISDKRHNPVGYMRHWNMEAWNMINEFGLKNLPMTFQDSWKQAGRDPYAKSDFVMGYYPKDHPVAQLAVPRPNRPFVLLTVMKKDEHLVDMSFRDRLLPIWRPSYESDEIYGRSPAMDALKEAKMGNVFSQADQGAAQLAVQPMMNVHKKNKGMNQYRPWGEHIFDNPNEKTSPVSTGINLPHGIDREERLARAVQDHFKIPIFKFLTNYVEREMSATEVIERKGEQVRLLSTELNSLNPVLNEQIEMTFVLGLKNNLLPDNIPQELIDATEGKLDIARMIDYTGPLALIQKTLFRTQTTDFALERLAKKAQLNPEVLDVVKWTENARRDLKADGFPVDDIASEREIQKIRDARAAKQQMIEDQAMAESQAEILNKTRHLQPA